MGRRGHWLRGVAFLCSWRSAQGLWAGEEVCGEEWCVGALLGILGIASKVDGCGGGD